jgi:hypothetical protein
MKNLYIPVTWPDIQYFMDKEGFDDNTYLILDDNGMAEFGSSAYFINYEWYKKQLNDLSCK